MKLMWGVVVVLQVVFWVGAAMGGDWDEAKFCATAMLLCIILVELETIKERIGR